MAKAEAKMDKYREIALKQLVEGTPNGVKLKVNGHIRTQKVSSLPSYASVAREAGRSYSAVVNMMGGVPIVNEACDLYIERALEGEHMPAPAEKSAHKKLEEAALRKISSLIYEDISNKRKLENIEKVIDLIDEKCDIY